MNWQGAWDSAANYVTDDAVSYLGSSWRAVQANTNIAPVEGADWTIVAQKGADGDAGSGGGGTVTSVSATGPLTVTNGATTPQISLSGAIPVENGGTGSTTQNFVDLTTTQSGIAGDKTFTGTLSGNAVNAATQFNIGGNRVLSVAGHLNTFAGVGAGNANTTGISNTFVGGNAGLVNQTTVNNSFFGADAGRNNIADSNSFFGRSAGFDNTTGTLNSFVGLDAGRLNAEGNDNSFFGAGAGRTNTTGSNNTAIGRDANVGSGDLSFATALGAGALVSTNNTVVLGRSADTVQIPGTLSSNTLSATTQFNLGSNRVLSVAGTSNVFAGVGAGRVNTTGGANSFFGTDAGYDNLTGNFNSFFGWEAGHDNTAGAQNSFFGVFAGRRNLTGNSNSFFGISAGHDNTTGANNALFGQDAGRLNTEGNNNVFFGFNAGRTNLTGDNNTIIGTGANVAGSGLNFATAIGAGAVVSSSNTIVLGRTASIFNPLNGPETVVIPGQLYVGNIPSGDFRNVQWNNLTGQFYQDTSSRRYKENIRPLAVDFMRMLEALPHTYTRPGNPNRWEIGFIAEEMDALGLTELVEYDAEKRPDGVRYDKIPLYLTRIAANQQTVIKQQQTELGDTKLQISNLQSQVKEQQALIDGLRKLVCQQNPQAGVCKEEKSTTTARGGGLQ